VGCSDGFVDEIEVPETVSEDQWEIVNTTAFTHVQITCRQCELIGSLDITDCRLIVHHKRQVSEGNETVSSR
jgi:hypothetical protein